MGKFHINANGEPGKCSAEKIQCPFGGDDKHFGSEEAAYDRIRRDYSVSGEIFKNLKKEFKYPEKTEKHNAVASRQWHSSHPVRSEMINLKANKFSMAKIAGDGSFSASESEDETLGILGERVSASKFKKVDKIVSKIGLVGFQDWEEIQHRLSVTITDPAIEN